MSNSTATPVQPTTKPSIRRSIVLPHQNIGQKKRRGLLKRIVAEIVRPIRQASTQVQRRLVRLGARSRFFATLYYTLFDRSFDREHQVILAGRVAFENAKQGGASTSSLLRRNIHRLEKGLLMRPRREIFAFDYIGETVSFYIKEVESRPADRVTTSDEMRWAHDVLKKYFAVTSDHPRICALREKFSVLANDRSVHGADWVPYRRDLSKPPTVAYHDLLDLARRRRSVRWFLPKSVPRDRIEKAIAVASLSPSACNRQPFIFRVFDDPEIVLKIASLPGGTIGFDHQFPAIVVLIGETRNYYGERDRHLIYIDASLAAMSFVFAAETLGLSTCCINWPDIEEYERVADQILQLEKDQRIIMFLAVGYPDPEGMVAYSQKKPITQICKYNLS